MSRRLALAALLGGLGGCGGLALPLITIGGEVLVKALELDTAALDYKRALVEAARPKPEPIAEENE